MNRSRHLIELAQRGVLEKKGEDSEYLIFIPESNVDSDKESDIENDEFYLNPSSPKAVPVDFYEEMIPSETFTVLEPMSLEENQENDVIEESEGEESEIVENEEIINDQLEPLCLTVSKERSPSRIKKTKTKEKVKKLKPLEFNWVSDEFVYPVTIPENNFSVPQEILPPLSYFKKFIDDDLIALIVENTNLYSFQNLGKSIETNKEEISDFLAIELLMGIVQMPAYTDYWSQNLRYDRIANLMTLKRYQTLRRYLHFANNEETNDDRYYKIRPFFEHVRKNCHSLEQERKLSGDEMMVPYKGTKAGSRRQFMKAKPKKWGFKMFALAGVSGIVYDMILYGGDDTFRGVSFSEEEEQFGLSAKVIIALCQNIKDKACTAVYFDNFFCSPDLVHYLRHNKGILSLGTLLGTLRANRTRGCEFKTDKQLRGEGRGSFQQLVDHEKRVVVVKWFDNKPVMLRSSFVGSEPISTIKRHEKGKREKSDVPCPEIVKEYNAHMGGVDLADMLVAVYRTAFRTHRWYMAIFSQLLDIAVNNAWLLYRRDLQLRKQSTCH